MNVKRVGIVGWRGMVGSVLINRMIEEKDFDDIADVVFFSTSQAGKDGPNIGKGSIVLQDANNIKDLKHLITNIMNSFKFKIIRYPSAVNFHRRSSAKIT